MKNNGRVSAARAYDELTKDYVKSLCERPIMDEDVIMVGTLIKKRIERSKHACETISVRLQSLSEGIRALSDLLRTRVDVSLQFMAVPFLVIAITNYTIELFEQVYRGDRSQSIVYVVVFVIYFLLYTSLPLIWRKIKYSKRPWVKAMRLLPIINRFFPLPVLETERL